jgi:cation:H+ antiporter
MALIWIKDIVLLIVGFVLLVKGADFFVDGAAGIAEKLKVSTFIIGLTVVALGTSAPEAAVSVIGGVQTVTGINAEAGKVIMGNVLGSNMMNILLILGITALIAKIPVEKNSRYIELPFLIVISVLFLILGDIGNSFVWYDGFILILLYAAFMAYTIIMAKKNKPALIEEATATTFAESGTAEVALTGVRGFFNKVSVKYESLKNAVWFLIVITIVGLAMVVGGAQLVVDSATEIAQDLLKIDPSIVALTVVAFGTSLPELVTSVSAARKGDTGLAIGNIIGSNIANILFVAGLGFMCSGTIGVAFNTSDLADGYMSIIAAVVLLVFSFFKGNNLTKIAGGTFLALLVAYYTYRILATVGVVPQLIIPTLFS